MTDSFSIALSDLSKTYGDRTVLDVDSLQLTSGHAYALVGANGSGKSTLLKVLSGVVDPTAGSIGLSENIQRESLSVGYMPQRSYAFGFSVFRNVSMALSQSGLEKREIEQRVNAALEAVGMLDMAHARGSSLSGGEAQRMALARILVRELDIVLLDEPTASMDVAGTMLVEKALAEYRERTNCLLVVATHAPSQARRISDTTLMLAAGKIVECGSTAHVLSQPTSPEGREFLSYWAV